METEKEVKILEFISCHPLCITLTTSSISSFTSSSSYLIKFLSLSSSTFLPPLLFFSFHLHRSHPTVESPTPSLRKQQIIIFNIRRLIDLFILPSSMSIITGKKKKALLKWIIVLAENGKSNAHAIQQFACPLTSLLSHLLPVFSSAFSTPLLSLFFFSFFDPSPFLPLSFSSPLFIPPFSQSPSHPHSHPLTFSIYRCRLAVLTQTIRSHGKTCLCLYLFF